MQSNQITKTQRRKSTCKHQTQKPKATNTNNHTQGNTPKSSNKITSYRTSKIPKIKPKPNANQADQHQIKHKYCKSQSVATHANHPTATNKTNNQTNNPTSQSKLQTKPPKLTHQTKPTSTENPLAK